MYIVNAKHVMSINTCTCKLKFTHNTKRDGLRENFHANILFKKVYFYLRLLL